MDKKIAVIGGGAAGMMAAIWAAYAGAYVCVYERNDRLGKKILSTGNGKCNFSNEVMDADCYYGSGTAYVKEIYDCFGVTETKQFFQRLGMRIKDRNGYLYPASEQAATVSDILRYEMERLGIRIYLGCRVTGISSIIKEQDMLRNTGEAGNCNPGSCGTGESRRPGKQFVIETDTAESENQSYDAVIVACGGRAAPKTGSDGEGFAIVRRLGHQIVPTVPALTALRCGETFFKQIAGVRCEAELTLYIDGVAERHVEGELQLTDYGISGIPVFQFSRVAAYALRKKKQVMVKIDFMPGTNNAFWKRRWEKQKTQHMEQFVTGIANKKVGLLLLELAGIRVAERASEIADSRREKLETLFRSFTVTVRETNSYEQAQVCAGGVDFGEVTETLESVKVPGLFFAGEILDIDGICGGYNLQWAWSSGAMAGCAATGKMKSGEKLCASGFKEQEDNTGMADELLSHLDRLHTTELGSIRIRKNLALDIEDIVAWCKEKIALKQAVIKRQGKNWYIDVDGCVITVNAYSDTIITAHKKRAGEL